MWAKKYATKENFIGRLSHNGDLFNEINEFCNKNNIRCAFISIIGAVKNIKLGYYKQQEQEYIYLDDIKSEGPYEIVHCTGNISIKDYKPMPHLHIVVSDRNGNCFGGHLMPGTTLFAGEFFIQELEGDDLVRGLDKETGLPLWKE